MTTFRVQPVQFLLEESFVPQDKPVIKPFQIMKTGSFFDPRYKNFKITEKMLNEIVKNFDQGVRGVVPALDYSHDSGGKAAGWFRKLYIKDGKAPGQKELWADIDLTPGCQKVLSDKEFAYISPDYSDEYVDNETGKKYGCVLSGAALTNRPVLKSMTPAIQLSEGDDDLNSKIVKLISEGKSQEQAVAIAIDMKEKGKLTEKGDSEMNEEEKKKMADMEAQLGEMKKLQDEMGASSPEELMKKIAEMKAQLAAMPKAKEQEVELGETKKQLSEVSKKLVDAEAKLKTSEKETEFAKLLSEGKACAAQKEAFLAGDMKKFIELAQPVKLSEQGSSHIPADKGDGADVEEEILTEAKKLSDSKKISIKDAISEVLQTNKTLAEKRKKAQG